MSRKKYGTYIDIARDHALKSNMTKRHGAVLVYNGKIISTGYNYYKPNNRIHTKIPQVVNGQYSIHAEVNCINNCPYKYRSLISKSTLIVIRIFANGEITSSPPCENCKKFIIDNKIKITIHS